MSGWYFEVRDVGRPRGKSIPARSFSRLNCVPYLWTGRREIALHAEIRLTVGGKKWVSANCLSSTSLAPTSGEAKSKVLCFSVWQVLRCTVGTPDYPVLISPPAGAAPLCAITGSSQKNWPQSRKQAIELQPRGYVEFEMGNLEEFAK